MIRFGFNRKDGDDDEYKVWINAKSRNLKKKKKKKEYTSKKIKKERNGAEENDDEEEALKIEEEFKRIKRKGE